LKSFKKSTITNISTNTELINQFKAYLSNQNVSSISNFEYIFDKRKLLKEFYQGVDGADLSKLFDNEAAAEEFIKKEFQKMFENNAEEIFNANSQLFFGKQWNGVTITRWEILRDLAKDDPTFWQSEFFSFIKVQ